MTKIVSEVQIAFVKPCNGLIAFASLLLFESLYISSIGIHKKLNDEGYRLTYPTKLVGGKQINLYHPINKELSLLIEEAIFENLNDVMKKCNDRYSCSDAT